MKLKVPVLAMSAFTLLGNSSAAPLLADFATLLHSPICQPGQCRQTNKITLTDIVLGKIIYAEYERKDGIKLTAQYTTGGQFISGSISTRRLPLDENDRKVILDYISQTTGAQYTDSVLESCFREALVTARPDQFFASQVGRQKFAAGTISNSKVAPKVAWTARCYTFSEPYGPIFRVTTEVELGRP